MGLAACGEEDLLTLNTFEVTAPVLDVPCDDDPWVVETAPEVAGLSGIWGAAADDVWAVGARGAILHWNGSSWQHEPVVSRVLQDLLAVHGQGDNVWAVGREGLVLRREAGMWSEVSSSANEDLIAVRVLSDDDVWFAGPEGLFHFDGRLVVPRQGVGQPSGAINGLAGDGPGNIWLVQDQAITHWDGNAFSAQPITGAGRIAAIYGPSDRKAFAIGHGANRQPGFGALVEGGWSFESAPNRSVFFAVFALPTGEVLVGASEASIYRHENGAWCHERIGSVGGASAFYGASSGGDVWVVGAERVEGETRNLLLRRK